MGDPTTLYPQPPPATQNLVNNPQALMSLANQAQALRQSQADFAARQAGGGALLGAIRPDGTVDTGAALASLPPDAAYNAPELVNSILEARTRQIAGSAAQFNLGAGQSSYIMSGLGALANKPDLTKGDVLGFVTTLARNSHISSEE